MTETVVANPEDENRRPAWRKHWAELCLLLIMLAAGATILLQHQIFGRDIFISPDANLTKFAFSGYSDKVSGGQSVLVSTKPLSWSCQLRTGTGPHYCGYEIVLDGNGATPGADFSHLDAIELSFDYAGPPTTLRLHLKNEDLRYSKHGDRSTSKINRAEFSIVPGRNRIVLHARDFSVAEWWLSLHQLAPELGRTQLDNIVAIEFMTGTVAPDADYHFSIRSLRVSRSAISSAQLYLAILGVVAACIILYTFLRIRRAREEARERARLEAQARMGLAEAKTAAENASKAKSDFLANMSHELRTPLNAVLGYAQLLQRAPLSEKEMNAARVIHRSGSHLLALITDILDLSKIEAGKMELAPAPCDPRALIDAVQEIVRVPAEQKGLILSVLVADDLPAGIAVDEKRLRQVLLNLLGNAVKFTSSGRVSLLVTQLKRDQDRALLRFEVQDSGPGIAPDEIERIFRPFEQVGEVRRREGGTGLGLTISRQFVRLMGSEILVQSRVGQGSSFWFELDVSVAETDVAGLAIDVAAIGGYSGDRRHVLIADDMDDNRNLLRDFLGQIGFKCSEARDGREALQIAQRVKPDIVLMDLKMPVMDGCEATRLMRIIEVLKEIPVIILSANIAEEAAAASMVAGANAFLSKPVDTGELLLNIGRLCGIEWTVTEREGEPGDTHLHAA
jgi:signal transduction histidine kinase/CheY-like chemotaxis protein